MGGEGRLPNFLIIGLPKAGTTSLASYLSVHPEAFMSEEKELHFFDGKKRDEGWYRAQFARAGDAKAVGEATPTYILNRRAMERMAAMLPDAKLIVMLRNPVDRAYSHYWWNRAIDERRDFAAAVREEIRGARSDRPATDPIMYRSYTGGGRYLELLTRVCELYPRERLLPVVLEDMSRDPRSAHAAVCGFLSIDPVIAPPHLGEVMNPAYRVRSERLRKMMLAARAWKRLPFGLADRIDRLNRAPLAYAPMDPALRDELVAWFAPANRALAEWLGRDLSAWDR
jgi:sulfotransferase family protein